MIKGYQTTILESYEKIQDKEKKALEARKKEIAKLHPEILKLDSDIQKLSLHLSIALLNSQNSSETFKEYKSKITEIRAQKYELLISNGYPADFLNLHYECERCKDTGFIGTNKCSCYNKKLIDLYYKDSHIQNILTQKNFENFNINLFSSKNNNTDDYSPRKNMELILNYILREYLPQFKNNNTNLLFYGNPGTGKSFLSYCIAKELLDKGFLVVYKTSDELISDLKDIRFNNNTVLENILINCDLLIIDDLGAEQKNEFSIAELFNLLNKKLLINKKMLISTNLLLPDIQNIYSERISSRLMGDFKLFKFYADDIRIALNLQNQKK